MQPHVVWLTLTDLDILRFLHGHEIDEFHVPPTVIAVNINRNRSTVSRRINVLSEADLVAKTDADRGYYGITDLGRRYLDEDLSEDELEELRSFDPDDV